MKPMLAATCEDINTLTFPVIASPKLDGIRCIVKDGVALSRNLKPIPNKHVQEWAFTNAMRLNGLDGELIVGEHDEYVFNRTTSGIMSRDGTDDFTYHVFDKWDSSLGFVARYLAANANAGLVPKVVVVEHLEIATTDELLEFENLCLSRGYEGCMVRSSSGIYKNGRSTVREGGLLKVKRFVDGEAIVIGYEERLHNDNPETIDALGHTNRSSHASNMRPAGDLGALVVRDIQSGIIFRIGSGYTAKDRIDIWSRRNDISDCIVKYKHFPMGAIDKPRFPIFLGFRHADDMSA